MLYNLRYVTCDSSQVLRAGLASLARYLTKCKPWRSGSMVQCHTVVCFCLISISMLYKQLLDQVCSLHVNLLQMPS